MKEKLLKKNESGFTLIELVIVLAIAALVIVGVLIAVNGAQQSRRDSERRTAATTTGALLEEWAANHNSALPTAAQQGAFTTVRDTRLNIPGANTNYPAPTYTNVVANCDTLAVGLNQNMIGIAGRNWQVCHRLESGDSFRANN